MQTIEELINIVGSQNVYDDPEILLSYARDQSFYTPHMPHYVVKPKNADEIQKIIKLANTIKMSVIPCSSGIHFYGNTIPSMGGIVLDLRRMNQILEIDTKSKMARIEPGVTWGQLQTELASHDMFAFCPLLPHPLKSVVTSHLEREPALIPKFEYAGSMVTLEVVLPDGELFRTGSACVPGFPDECLTEGAFPGGPGDISWNWLLQGAQGTLGVVTWAQVKIAPCPRTNKTYIIPFERIEDAIQLVYNVQKRMIGEECLILNSFNMATILADKWPQDFNSLIKKLSPWIVILISGGGWRLPEGRIEYETQGLHEAAAELHIPELPVTIPGIPGIEKDLPRMLRTAWTEKKPYWKFAYKGNCQDLFFHTTLNRTPEFVRHICRIAARYDYTSNDIGFYIQPLEYGRACHFESNFTYDSNNLAAIDKVRNLFAEAVETTLDMGAFYTRPYGIVSNMVYERTASYTIALRKLKQLMDPNNIMSPGRLCF